MNLTKPLLIARVDIAKMPAKRSVLHLIGLPGVGAGAMADPIVVVLSEDPNGNFMLDRYSPEGRPAGDTWHQTMPEAKAFAVRKFGGGLGEWVPIEGPETDVRVLARRLLGLSGS